MSKTSNEKYNQTTVEIKNRNGIFKNVKISKFLQKFKIKQLKSHVRKPHIIFLKKIAVKIEKC